MMNCPVFSSFNVKNKKTKKQHDLWITHLSFTSAGLTVKITNRYGLCESISVKCCRKDGVSCRFNLKLHQSRFRWRNRLHSLYSLWCSFWIVLCCVSGVCQLDVWERTSWPQCPSCLPSITSGAPWCRVWLACTVAGGDATSGAAPSRGTAAAARSEPASALKVHHRTRLLSISQRLT